MFTFTASTGVSFMMLCLFAVVAVGYLLGRISIKGISLGTAGVFLFALLFGYLCTLPGLKEIPLLQKFYMENAADGKIPVKLHAVVHGIAHGGDGQVVGGDDTGRGDQQSFGNSRRAWRKR